MASCEGKNPGPIYALRTVTGYEGHCYSKNRAPAFSLGLKLTSKRPHVTPGPYYVGSVDRNGKAPYLGWTIESKSRGHSKGEKKKNYKRCT